MDRSEQLHKGEGDYVARILGVFLVGHLLVWTLVPFLTQPNAPLDCIELLSWGHQWQWGYFKHPPLPAWLCEIAAVPFGSVDWPLYLISQLCIVGCFYTAWRMARETLAPWASLAAVVVMEACHYFSFTSVELNNNVAARVLWAFAILSLYWAIRRDQRRWWCATGFALALAMLSKYDAALLIASMFIFSIAYPAARRHWRTSGPYLMIAVLGVCLAPHAVWLIENDFQPLQYFRDRSATDPSAWNHLYHPLKFVSAQLLALGIPMLLMTGILGWRWRLRKLETDQRFQRDFLVAVVLGPCFLAVLYSLGTGAHLRSMWGSAMWTYGGVLAMLAFRSLPSISVATHKKMAIQAIAVGGLFAVSLAAKNVVGPVIVGKGSRVHFPGRELAGAVETQWRNYSNEPLPEIAGDTWLAANVGYYAKQRVTVYPGPSAQWAPWTSDDELRRRGGVLIWDVTVFDRPPEKWLARFPRARVQPIIDLPWKARGVKDSVKIGIAIVPPADARHLIASGQQIDRGARRQ